MDGNNYCYSDCCVGRSYTHAYHVTANMTPMQKTCQTIFIDTVKA